MYKNIVLIVLSSLFSMFFVNGVFAVEGTPVSGVATPAPTSPTTVIVTEDIPGAGCLCVVADDSPTGYHIEDKTKPEDVKKCGSVTTRKYECPIAAGGLSGFTQLFASIIRWFVNITMLLGVLAIVGLGIGYAVFSGGDEEKTKMVKGYAMNLIIGLTILFFFRYILQWLAPWIYQ